MKVFILLLIVDPLVSATEFSARVVDNLGNPVAGARIVASCYELRRDGSFKRIRPLFAFQSGSNGIVNGSYKQLKATCEKSVRVRVEREGYGASHYNEFRPVYVVRRRAKGEELHRIVQLTGDDLTVALRDTLTSDVDGTFQELVFYYEDRLRPTLRLLAKDPEAGIAARSLLAFIGVPDDLRLVVDLGSPKDRNPAFAYRWLYGVTCSLLEPTSEAEWALLRESALGEYEDLVVTRGAIQSLTLIALPRSRQILEEVHRSGSFGAKLTQNAIEYIQSNPQPLQDRQLEDLGHRVAQALGNRTWTGNATPKYNEAGDKAFILLNFDVGTDFYVYTAAFQRVDGAWVCRGVRESMAGFKLSAGVKELRKK